MLQTKKKSGNQELIETDCPICGRVFIPAVRHSWSCDNVLVCTYACQVKGDRERWRLNPKKKSRREHPDEVKKAAVDLVLREGYTCRAAGEKTNVSPYTVSVWVRRYLEGELLW